MYLVEGVVVALAFLRVRGADTLEQEGDDPRANHLALALLARPLAVPQTADTSLDLSTKLMKTGRYAIGYSSTSRRSEM